MSRATEFFERKAKEVSMFNIDKFWNSNHQDLLGKGIFKGGDFDVLEKDKTYKWEAYRTMYDWIVYIDYNRDDVSANCDSLIAWKDLAQKLMNATDEVMQYYVKY